MARDKRSLVNRRSFLPTQVKPVCETWPLLERLAFHQTTTQRLTFKQDVETYRHFGARAFGAWRFKVEDFGEFRAFDLLKEKELTVSSLSWAGGFAYSDGEAYEAAIADAFGAVKMAQTLDASCLVVLPGTRGSYTVNHGRRMIIEALQRVADVAGARGVQIALQPVDKAFAGDGCFLDSLDKMLEFLTDCRHPQIGLNLDLFHLRNTPGLLQRIPELLPWIRLVQLSDCQQKPTSDMDRCLLGTGTLPVVELVDALEVAGYRGFYEVPLMSTVCKGNYSEVLRSTRRTFEELATAR
ncbi:MAG: TIM barrel protein [Planctomycetota bacterium]